MEEFQQFDNTFDQFFDQKQTAPPPSNQYVQPQQNINTSTPTQYSQPPSSTPPKIKSGLGIIIFMILISLFFAGFNSVSEAANMDSYYNNIFGLLAFESFMLYIFVAILQLTDQDYNGIRISKYSKAGKVFGLILSFILP